MTNYTFSSPTINAGGNAKTIKGDDEYVTAIMYLSPAETVSGINTCAMAKLAGCESACLYTAGRGRFTSIQTARMAKTSRFRDSKEEFIDGLFKDVARFVKWCAKRDVRPAIRLNGTSDIRWEIYSMAESRLNIFDTFPDVQFYDYTKLHNRRVKQYKNYHLTWSYSEANPNYTKNYKEAIQAGMNIAVVFRNADSIPKEFLGLKVVDGDKDDLRFLDPKNSVVALYAKGSAKKDQSGFVIN